MESAPCLESLPAFLALSSQSPSGPAGGAPDGYGLGRGATGPRGTTPAARAQAELHACTGPDDAGIDYSGPGGATLTARDRATSSRLAGTGLLRVASQDVTILMSAHAPPPGPIRARA